MIKTEIVISGAGIAGLLTALKLGISGLDVVLIETKKLEAEDNPVNDGRTSALMMPALVFLRSLGIWQNIEDEACPLKIMRIIDGDVESCFEAEEAGLEYFSCNIPNNILRSALINALKKCKSVKILDETGLWDFEEKSDHMLVRLSDDQEIFTKLLIAADGKNSQIRDIAGIKAIKTGYKQNAITCLINHSKSHENISTEFHKPGGPFTLVPCRGNQSSVVWCEKTSDAEELMKLKKSDFVQALQDMTHNILGEITLETSPQSWPLNGMVSRKITAHRIALIAEAAHTLHPIGAQGLNLSILDIDVLCGLIIKQKSLGLDVGALNMLKEYKALRRNDIYVRFAGVTGMCSLTSKKSKGVQRLRQAGLRLMNKSEFMRKKVMRIGLGVKNLPSKASQLS